MASKEVKALGGAASGASTGAAFGPYGALIGGVAGGLGGLLGGDDSGNSAQLAQNQALWNALMPPSAEDLAVNYNNYNYAGDVSPKMDVAQQLGQHDALQDVNLDPRLKQAQMSALDTLSKIAGSGFTPDEKASLDAARQQRDADVTSKLKALQQNQDMRGVGNSDMALAQQMMQAQSSANSGAADARAEQAQAYKRSLDAIMNKGSLASNMENTDYSRQANLANNLNSRELTNLGQRANVGASNVNRFNNALQYNNTNQQNVMNKNTDTQHSQANFNSQAKENAFANQIAKVNGQTGANVNVGNANIAQQNRNNATTSGLFDSVAKGAGAYLANNPADNTQQNASDWANNLWGKAKPV